jgi:hypothetical protein
VEGVTGFSGSRFMDVDVTMTMRLAQRVLGVPSSAIHLTMP